MADQHSPNSKLAIGVLAVILTAAGAAVFFSMRSGPSSPQVEWGTLFATPTSTPSRSNLDVEGVGSERVAPAGQKEFRNTHYGFSLFFPKELLVRDFDEGNGARSFVFGNEDQTLGFQIFVVPYPHEQIDRERFLLDQPSGVMEEPVEVLIDGTRATVFFGRNSIMGDTREVWFIHGGFLFEIVTFKELDAWLSGVMRSWRWLGA